MANVFIKAIQLKSTRIKASRYSINGWMPNSCDRRYAGRYTYTPAWLRKEEDYVYRCVCERSEWGGGEVTGERDILPQGGHTVLIFTLGLQRRIFAREFRFGRGRASIFCFLLSVRVVVWTAAAAAAAFCVFFCWVRVKFVCFTAGLCWVATGVLWQ